MRLVLKRTSAIAATDVNLIVTAGEIDNGEDVLIMPKTDDIVEKKLCVT